MSGARRVLVVGGYGTFGSQVARELAARGVAVTVAGRDPERAARAAAALPGARGLALDLADAGAVHAAVADHEAAACCAGPFGQLAPSLLEACLAARVPYADLADDRAWAARVRVRSGELAARGVTAAWGCSSLPSISSALAVAAADGRRWTRARVTLFIGNQNAKGEGSIASAVAVIGRRIEAPQGALRGFAGRTRVALPPPWGRRSVWNFESPDYDLLPALVGAREVEVKVGFEVGLAGAAFSGLGALGSRWGDRTVRLLEGAALLVRGRGRSGGAVQVELGDGEAARRAAISCREGGQRMAALPLVFAIERLLEGATRPGAATAAELVPDLLARLVQAGHELTVE
jgi:hypothetical protein